MITISVILGFAVTVLLLRRRAVKADRARRLLMTDSRLRMQMEPARKKTQKEAIIEIVTGGRSDFVRTA